MSLAIFAEKSAYSLHLPIKKLGFRVVVVLGISARCQGRLKRKGRRVLVALMKPTKGPKKDQQIILKK